MPLETSYKQDLKGHLVILTIPAWGVLRPLCGVACRAVEECPDIVVTFMILGGWDKRIAAECDRYNRSNDDKETRSRLRLVNIGGQGFDIPDLMSVAFKSFPDCYRKLVLCESIRSMSTRDHIPQTIRPTAVIIDYNYFPILQSVREITGKNVPVWNWWSSGSYLPLRVWGPERYGGMGNVPDKARTLAEATGRDVDEVTNEMTNMKRGEVVVLPGLPDFYDYEWYPYPDDLQKDLPISFYEVFKNGKEFMKECDAYIYNTSSAYEPQAIDATRRWLEESGSQKLYTIGPVFPWSGTNFESPKHGLMATGDEVPENGSDSTPVRAFMDKILASHGENSLLYLSFGSIWWPGSDYIRLYVEILLENKIPFIFAIASPQADLPTELIEKVSASEIAMLSKWCPQQMILSHPVTGWFLTHCGHNSVLEALSRGVPMIAWPLMFDQPGNAAHISLSLDVAFQLIQVRTGKEGLKPLHRTGTPPVGDCESVAVEARDILRRMKGAEGDRKRKNAEGVRDKLGRARKGAGDGQEDFKRLLRDATKEQLHQ
ncbi:hypothetical protein GALMADRAFT_1162382 [Galerina marginata CBS 339.88]|uniref:UDP-glycosyltransferases domain-containing protein n=1 Tax=Galerina marginata (strain CBS 339.88) TaxID=685588 RepID=A0A067SHP0_GALM3|nr:hypothetical protein GALMADRAFT_1162382 [Galerina marginata CBS 339.88]